MSGDHDDQTRTLSYLASWPDGEVAAAPHEVRSARDGGL